MDHFIFTITLFSCFLSFVLLQCCLSSESSTNYTFVSIPLLFSTIIGAIIYFMEFSRIMIEVILFLCSISLSIILVGLYYDLPSHGEISSLGFTLPLFPLALVLLIASIHCTMKAIFFWGGCNRKDLIVSSRAKEDDHSWFRVCITLGANFTFVSSLLMMFLLLFNLILKAFQDNLSLSVSLTSAILIL